LSGVTSGFPNAAAGDGTNRAYTETILKDVVQQVWTEGGDARMLMVGALLKQKVSTFAGIAEQRFQVTGRNQGTIIGAADVYVSDFGDLNVVPNRFMPQDVAYHVDPSMAAIAFLRPFQKEELAKTGDADKMLLICEWGVKVNNERAHGVARDLIP
jgi:hypothetical protein